MQVCYNKLWKLLIDKNMKKKELAAAAGISNSLIAKLGKNENVTVEVLVRICSALECRIEDILELVPEDKKSIQGNLSCQSLGYKVCICDVVLSFEFFEFALWDFVVS